MRNRVVGPVVLTRLLLVVVMIKQMVKEIRKSGRKSQYQEARQQVGSGGHPTVGWEGKAYIV